jgi:hypothetical protein
MIKYLLQMNRGACADSGFIHQQTRAFSAVLFRRISTKTRKDPISGDVKEVFLSLPNEQRVAIREKLVTCLTTEAVTDVRKKIGDAVAEVARQYTDNGTQFQPRKKKSPFALETQTKDISSSNEMIPLECNRRSMARAAWCSFPGQSVWRLRSPRDCVPHFHNYSRHY